MDILNVIDNEMGIIGIPYMYGEWTDEVTYPYFIGEQPSPEEIITEDGAESVEILVTGFHRGDPIALVEAKDKIRKHFHPVFGHRVQTENGAVAIFYGGAFFVPTMETDLSKIQITLQIKSWKGDL